jgi:two-component system response regulator
MKGDDPILLVEDNPDDIALTKRALERNDIRNPLVVAHDGEEALRALADGLRPALVLLDLKLPKVGGLEVLDRMNADDRLRLLPTVVLTSSREEEDVMTGYRLGANSYIRKPVDFADFVEVVRHIGLYWLTVNEPIPVEAVV